MQDAVWCKLHSMQEVCRELWCIGKSRRCVTNSVPAADGTNCSENGVTSGWCYKGECVWSGWQPIPVDGGWSQWSPWAACSRSCGGGVMFMERLCTKPKPSHGGKYCIGERKKFRSCNTQNCPQNGTDFRLLQCREFNRKPFRGKVYKWRPYSGEQINPCALTCLAEGFNFYTERAPKVIDGTKCFADTLDICVDGVCRHVGCDGILGSEVEEDNCRLCGGDGSTCTTVSGSFMKPLRKGTYEEVVIVPQGSVNVLIQEVVTSQNYIALKSTSTNHFYINGKWTIDWPGKVDVSNTVFQYERPENKPEVLRARGPTTEEVAVMILLQEENKGLKYQFNIPLPKQGRDPGLYYMWEYGNWTDCSASCGGGVRRSEAVCVQEDRQEQAQTDQCHGHLRPNQKTKPCNVQPCPPRWQAGRWSACSQTCGSGTRERSIICMRKINRHKDEVMRAAECAEQKPITTQICNTKQCPAVWVKSRWSLCSSRCGPGFKRRRLRCMSADHREYLPNKRCQDSQRRPPNKTRCNLQKCPPPAWKTGSWTKCSAECGPGKQRRSVACRTFTGKSSKQCDVTLKPANQKRCEGPCRQVANFSKKECVDRNKVAYCPLVLKFKFCDREYFQQMCCQTCRHHNS